MVAAALPADAKQSPLVRSLLTQLRALGLPEPELEYRFTPARRWRADMAWREARLLVEVDGGTWANGRHSRGKGFEADCEKTNTAQLLGYRCLRFTGGQVDSGQAAAMIEQALRGGE